MTKEHLNSTGTGLLCVAERARDPGPWSREVKCEVEKIFPKQSVLLTLITEMCPLPRRRKNRELIETQENCSRRKLIGGQLSSPNIHKHVQHNRRRLPGLLVQWASS